MEAARWKIKCHSPASKQIMEECINGIRDKFPVLSMEYPNEYVGAKFYVSAKSETFTLQREPITPSPDAIFPYALSSFGTKIKHISGNVTITSVPLNFMKHIWVPGLLEGIKEYVCVTGSVFDRPPDISTF